MQWIYLPRSGSQTEKEKGLNNRLRPRTTRGRTVESEMKAMQFYGSLSRLAQDRPQNKGYLVGQTEVGRLCCHPKHHRVK